LANASAMDDEPSDNLEIIWRTDRLDLNESLLAEALALVLQSHERSCAGLCVALVSDEEIARLNEQYLQHEGPTDVLSFNLSDSMDGAIEGQLVVSVDTARRNAAQRGHTLEAELALYCVHGLLHLLGYDDATEGEARSMHTLEDDVLVRLGLGAVYGGQRG
jgi:probable rRNA maturation factor